MLRRVKHALAGVVAGTFFAAPAFAQQEIQWWHAMGGELGQKVDAIAAGFNATQKEYKIVPIYKGSYTETMTGAIAAFRAKQHPHIVQVFEVGTATLMAAKGAVYPVYQLMKDQNLPFDPKNYLPSVTGYYSDSAGNMLSMPFNSSTPIMFYNKTLFKKAGLDPEVAPKTWPEIEAASKKLQAAGVKCGFTVGWPSWLLIENFSALHNVPIGTKSNGFDGLDTEFQFNSPLHLKLISAMGEWQKSKIFDYGGRAAASAPKFYTQECAMYMNSSASLAGVRANAKDFEVGVGMLPYWPDVKGAPQNSIIGGATLWVLSGHPKETYKGVGQFFNYLSQPEVQAKWHQETGYLPITTASYELSKTQGYYTKNPGTDVSIKQMTLNPPTTNSKGLRFGNYVQIRDVIDEELEGVWSGKKSAKEALDSAVTRGNELLRRFEAANK